MTDTVSVGWTRTTDAVVGHQRNLVVNELSDRQPVQRVTKYRSDVLVESSASDEARSGVQYGLQTPNSIRRSAVQDRVAVVHLAVNQCVDESLQCVEGERPSDRT